MPTEENELIEIVRDISVLMNMESYQDMSDAEIDLLIAYKIERALENYENSAYMDYAQESRDACLAAAQAQLAAADNMLEYVLGQQVPFVTVGANGTIIPVGDSQ